MMMQTTLARPSSISRPWLALIQRCSCQDEVQTSRCPESGYDRTEDSEREPDITGIVSDGLAGEGQRLDQNTQAFMENRFGHDFSQIKIHTDSRASQSAEAVAARAYTVGNDIAFRSGEYDPQSRNGRELIAHELTHTVQQGSAQRSVQRDDDDSTAATTESSASTDTAGAASQASDAATAPSDPAAAAADSATVDPVPPISGDETTDQFEAFGHAVPELHGLTRASFGRTFSVAGQTTTPGRGCRGCAPGDCVHVTGTLNITYAATTTVTLPSASRFPRLTECERGKVQDAINNILAPHEQQHVSAFHQFDGTSSIPLDINTCRQGVDSAIRAIINADQRPRAKAALDASAALDPFNFTFDMTCDEDAGSADTAPGDTAVAQQGEIDTSSSPVLDDPTV